MPDIARPVVRRPARIGVPPLPNDEPVAPTPAVAKPAPAPIRRPSRIGVPRLPDEPSTESVRSPVQAPAVSPTDASIARTVAMLRAIVKSPREPAVVLDEGEMPF